MGNRIQLVIFISILAAIFVLIWFVLGGEPVAKKSAYIMSGADEELLAPEDPRQVRRVVTSFSLDPSGSSNSGSDSSGYSSPSFPTFSGTDSGTSPEEDTEELKKKLMFGFNPKFLSKLKRSPLPSLEQRKARLRDELLAQGITNEAYINMMVLELEEEKTIPARDLAEVHIRNNNPGLAIRVLKEALDNTPTSNLLVRTNLYAQIGMIAGKFAFPDELLEATSKLADLQQQVLEIKRATPQVMANPETREQINAQYDIMVNKRAELIGQTQGAINMLIEHQGLHPDAVKMRNAIYLNLERADGSPFKPGEIGKLSHEQDEETKKAWSKPQYLR